MPNYNKATHQQRHGSRTASLDQVLDSLQALLDHDRHIFNPARPEQPAPLRIPEPFADLPAEQYDDPLTLDEDPVVSENLPDIPVLDEIIVLGADNPNRQEVEDMLVTLRGELDGIVDEIIQDTRKRLQKLNAEGDKNSAQQHLEDNLQRFLREINSRNIL